MIKPEMFELPMEAQFKLRKINDEIDECKDVEALQENLKNMTKMFMRYQHMLNMVLKEVIENNIRAIAEGQLK